MPHYIATALSILGVISGLAEDRRPRRGSPAPPRIAGPAEDRRPRRGSPAPPRIAGPAQDVASLKIADPDFAPGLDFTRLYF